MTSKSSFFSKFLAFFLIVIIIGGVGFLGFNLFKSVNGSMGSMTMGNNSTSTSKGNQSGDADKNTDTSSQGQMNMSGSSSKDSASTTSLSSTNTNNTSVQYSTAVINGVLLNKDSLEKTTVLIKDSLKLMTLDPYGVETKNNTNANQNTSANQNNNGQNQSNGNATTAQGGTVVNIYPQNGSAQAPSMQSMGTTYDMNKMQQLHTGLYKVSVGMQLLEQLGDNLSAQLEQASMEVINPSQYYYNQYLTTIQNKNKLNEAMTYLNEASSLININPYISPSGAVYDKERMNQIHDSIFKLAQGVVDLNKINDNFTKQAITLGNVAQSYMNNSQSTQGMDMTSTGLSFFKNINFSTVLNVIVIVFIILFVIAMVGYISRLMKAPKDPDLM